MIIDFILVVGMTITFILMLLTVHGKKHFSRFILLVFFFFIFMAILDNFAYLHKLKGLYTITVLFDFLIAWVIGPLLYLYIKSLFAKNVKEIGSLFTHFIPSVFLSLFFFIPLYVDAVFFNSFYFPQETIKPFLKITNIAGYAYSFTYAILLIKLHFEQQQKLSEVYSSIDQNNFGWIKQLLFCLLVISLFVLIVEIILSYIWSMGGFGSYLGILFIIISLFYLGFYGIKQTQFLVPEFLLNKRPEEQTKTQVIFSNKEKTSYALLKTKLDELMSDKKMYLNEELTLRNLSSALKVNDKKLSILLNQFLNTSFYDYVNTLRIHEVKRKMKSAEFDNYSLFGIAMESGFKSKSTFHRFFKKTVGCTPAEYKKSLESSTTK
ncbi:MAG: AraC family transcriptional regulator [Ignavibacteriae bacterium]|nr:AraC family transcriptional regulator [Ignavibacteriota bacterium]